MIINIIVNLQTCNDQIVLNVCIVNSKYSSYTYMTVHINLKDWSQNSPKQINTYM